MMQQRLQAQRSPPPYIHRKSKDPACQCLDAEAALMEGTDARTLL